MVVLIQPNYNYGKAAGGWGYNPPLGLAYLAAVLERNGSRVEIIDANVENLSPKQVAEYVMEINPAFIGISLMTTAHSYGIDIVKQLPESIMKIAGGPHATALPEEFLKNGFDIVIRGEGEDTILDIVNQKTAKEIIGISYKDKNGGMYHNPNRVFLNINELPLPARHDLRNGGVDRPYFSAGNIYSPFGSIFSSRGCPYSCYYCYKDVHGFKFRARTVNNIMVEIKELVRRYGIKELDFYDDCFNYDMERACSIMRTIKENKLKLYIRFSNGLRIDKMNEELLKHMHEAGVRYIAYGIESGDQNILDRIPKRLRLQQIEQVIKMTKNIGIQVMGFFMLGLLGDTAESMQTTIEFAKKLRLDYAQFTIATPYPGTKMWKIIKKDGRVSQEYNKFHHHDYGDEKWLMPEMASHETIKKMFKRANRQYYFRISEILKHLKKIRNLRHIIILIRGIRRTLYSLLKR
ncbi:MAG: radical SAM protein [Candidatus Omnitrophota bacterium]